MCLDKTIRIILDEEGWNKLDNASIKVHGEVEIIIKEMQSILDDDVVMALCERMGIVSTGFLFHDVFKKETRFFKAGKPDPTYKTQYLWDDRQTHNNWSDCVHELFVIVRTLQVNSRKTDDSSEEDYFVNLPGDSSDYRALEDEKEWRETYHVHYCTVGEMIYTTFVWRLLSFARDSGFGSKPLNEFFIDLDDRVTLSDCKWRNQLVLDSLKTKSGRKQGKIIDEIFSEFWGKMDGVDVQRTWGEEWKTLLLSMSDIRLEQLHRVSTYRFVYKSGFIRKNPSLDLDNAKLLNTELQNAIPGFLKWINGKREINSVNEALEVIEAKARFPILPFYFWNGMNKKPMCYMVVPIWTSQHYSMPVPGGKCHDLGLALTAVRPLANLDWTLEDEVSERISNAKVLVIINFLRLMARPLVESNLYQWLLLEIQIKRKEDIPRIIHDQWEKETLYKGWLKKIKEGKIEELKDLINNELK